MHVPSSWPAAAAAVVVVASIPPTPTTPVVMKPAFLLALARRSFLEMIQVDRGCQARGVDQRLASERGG